MMKRLPALVGFILLTVLVELLVRGGLVSSTLIPAPTQVLSTILEMRGDYQTALFETFRSTLLGLLLSVFIGGLLAFVCSLSEILRRAILPFAVFFQTVPIIAIAPLLVIYFGFGVPTVVASSFIVSVFPIIANTLAGLESVSSSQRDLFRIYQATSLQVLLKLKLPHAYPYIISGLRIAMGLSIIGGIAGEFVAGGGLGAMIDAARTQQRVDIVFGALLILSLLGLCFIATLNFAHRRIIRKRPFAQEES